MRTVVFGVLLLISNTVLAQQNCVVNPDFEAYSFCPYDGDQIRAAKYWSSTDSLGLSKCIPEYINSCADINSTVSAPQGGGYWQYPHSGNGMVEGVMFYDESYPLPPDGYYKDFIQGRLTKKLTAGKSYCVSFYVNLEEWSNNAIKDIGAYLDDGTIDTMAPCGPPRNSIIPQVVNTGGVLSDTMRWVKIEGSFTANGKEKFITIGNFRDKAHTTYAPIPLNNYNGGLHYSYYLIDDVSVVESGTKANAGPDTHVGQGDSVFTGLPDKAMDCYWTKLGSSIVVGTGAGI